MTDKEIEKIIDIYWEVEGISAKDATQEYRNHVKKLAQAIHAYHTEAVLKARKDEIGKMLEWAINNSGWCDEEYLEKRLAQLDKKGGGENGQI